MPESQSSNDRLATKMMRLDINRILLGWDPLALRGLPGWEREYEPHVGPILILVKKGAGKMEIARHLDGLLRETWKLPPDNARCVEIAHKLHNVGALFRGERISDEIT